MDDDVAAYVYNDVAAYIDDDMAVDVAMMTSPPHTQFIDEPKWPIISLILFYSTSSRNNKNSKSPNLNPLISTNYIAQITYTLTTVQYKNMH
jgi:hypothetical protein